jgi:DNA-binding transcriptional LysR family regulator
MICWIPLSGLMTLSDSPVEIRLFVAAYEERSFTAAASRENATQSGVSQHIRKLEERFGVRLFDRTGGQVVPTPAADSYYRLCLDILRAHETANQTLRSFGRGLEGEVVVGLMPTMTRCALAPALDRFVNLHPNVTVRIVEAYSAVLTQMVRSNELAFAVVPAAAGAPGLKSRLFARTPEVLVSAAARDLPHLQPIRLADLPPLKLVVPGLLNTRRNTVLNYIESQGVKLARVMELDAMLGTLDLVASTDWVTILPGVMMARDRKPDPFCINPLADPHLTLDLTVIESSRATLSPAAAAFQAVLQEATNQINSVWHPS